jgi:hypothetical protein
MEIQTAWKFVVIFTPGNGKEEVAFSHHLSLAVLI